MREFEEGFYDGAIVAGYVTQDRNGKFVANFDVNVDGGGAVTARHDLEGQYSEKTPGVFETLGLDWPKGVRMLAETRGQRVRVHIKPDGKYFNAKIVRQRRRDDDGAAAEAFLAKIEAERVPAPTADADDPIPF